jgi:hypothetical protein
MKNQWGIGDQPSSEELSVKPLKENCYFDVPKIFPLVLWMSLRGN